MCSKCSGLNCNNTAPTLIEVDDDDDNVDISTVGTASDDEDDD